ncbi:hypothetical protein T492DRAFT_890391 [Pavlovales sp. CCMP2436]|nr:hypothetical protein T492DRAFT_890391 [Pavlovales sp. CCMP2436]
MAPIRNEGKLRDMDSIAPRSPPSGEPGAIVTGTLAPISGVRTRTPLSSCGLPSGVGLSTRLLPPKGGETFDDSEFVSLDPQGLVAKNFLSASARMGNFTTGSNRIKNQQLRSEPVVERTLTLNNTAFGISPHMTQEYERPFEMQVVNDAEVARSDKQNDMGDGLGSVLAFGDWHEGHDRDLDEPGLDDGRLAPND